MNENTYYSWNWQQLNRLLQIGSDLSTRKDATNKAACLDQILSQNLPLDKTTAEFLPVIIKPFCRSMGLLIDEPLISFLLNPATNLDVLKQIKNFAKETMSSAVLSSHREAAAVVYYAAIAGALLAFHQRITGLSYQQLLYTFSRLKEKKWILAELRTRFQNACQACKEKETSQ